MDISRLIDNLTTKGYEVKFFSSAQDLYEYMDLSLRGKAIGIGGSMTVDELGLYDILTQNNDVFWHWHSTDKQRDISEAANAEVYISSANAVSISGDIINIDGVGNRVASTLYGHEKVIFIIGKNKVCKSLEEAISRARNTAAPLNAKRLNLKTPCSSQPEKCYDCNSKERICSALVVLLGKPENGTEYQVLIVDEVLGF